MLNRQTLVSAVAISFMFAGSATADLILGTDFEGTTPSGNALNGVTFSSDFGITSSSTVLTTDPSRIAAVPLHTTDDTAGYLAADVNFVPNEWLSVMSFTTQDKPIELQDLELTWANFLFNGDSHFLELTHVGFVGIRDVADDSFLSITRKEFGGLSGLDAPQTEIFDLSGTLNPDTTYDLALAFSGGGLGTIGVDALSLNSVAPAAVPEPAAFSLVGLLCLAASVRRRRRHT